MSGSGDLLNDVRKVDTSGRLALGRERAGEQFGVEEMEDGSFVLTPVALIPKSEIWLHRNLEAKKTVMRGLADSAAGRTSDGGDFSEFLADDEA